MFNANEQRTDLRSRRRLDSMAEGRASEHEGTEGSALLAGSGPGGLQRLMQSPAIGASYNTPVRAAGIRQMQQTVGNRAVQRASGGPPAYGAWGSWDRWQQEQEKRQAEAAEAAAEKRREQARNFGATAARDPWSDERYKMEHETLPKMSQQLYRQERAEELASPRFGLPEKIIGGIGSQISPQLAQVSLAAADAVQDSLDVVRWAGEDTVDALNGAHEANAAKKGLSSGAPEMAWGALAPQLFGSPTATTTGFDLIGAGRSVVDTLGAAGSSLWGEPSW